MHYNDEVATLTGDICQLENKCSASLGTHCNTKYISSSFPPGAYHCVCDNGFVPHSTPLPGNVLSPGGKCIKKQSPGELKRTSASFLISAFLVV